MLRTTPRFLVADQPSRRSGPKRASRAERSGRKQSRATPTTEKPRAPECVGQLTFDLLVATLTHGGETETGGAGEDRL